MDVKVIWLDGESATLSKVDKVHVDQTGRNLYVYKTLAVSAASVLGHIFPLANIREVEYL
jgi:hypothetical protein